MPRGLLQDIASDEVLGIGGGATGNASVDWVRLSLIGVILALNLIALTALGLRFARDCTAGLICLSGWPMLMYGDWLHRFDRMTPGTLIGVAILTGGGSLYCLLIARWGSSEDRRRREEQRNEQARVAADRERERAHLDAEATRDLESLRLELAQVTEELQRNRSCFPDLDEHAKVRRELEEARAELQCFRAVPGYPRSVL